MRENLADKSAEQLAALVADLGEPKFRAGQIARGIAQGKEISEMTDLSKSFRERLAERYDALGARILETLTGADGTEKYLFSLADGNVVEGVLMNYKYGTPNACPRRWAAA